MEKFAMISQPMQGRTVEAIRKEREAGIAYLEEQGYTVLDTVFTLTEPCIHEAIAYMAKGLEVMARCSLVLFLDSWQCARGCQMEFELCRTYGVQAQTFREVVKKHEY